MRKMIVFLLMVFISTCSTLPKRQENPQCSTLVQKFYTQVEENGWVVQPPVSGADFVVFAASHKDDPNTIEALCLMPKIAPVQTIGCVILGDVKGSCDLGNGKEVWWGTGQKDLREMESGI